jgi:N-acetylneuraminate synthase
VKQWKQLKAKADECGVQFISSPFSLEAVDVLEEVGVAFYKVPSGEVTNVPLLEHVAGTGRPTVLSSGMSNWDELDRAVEVLRPGGPLTLMQCSSVYPCPAERVGLNILSEMRERYDLPVGLSDHTRGLAAAVAAVAQGAVMIEKHLTFHRGMYGSDAQHSAEPGEFKAMVEAIRDVETMLANEVDKDDLSPYGEMKDIFEKSLVASEDLPVGTELKREHLAFKKPGDGIKAADYSQWLGRRLARAVSANTQLTPDDFE